MVLDCLRGAHYVAAALRVGPKQKVILGGVYIPPSHSRYMTVAYADLLDEVAEAVAALQLRHSITSEAVLLVGDFNAHIGRERCGQPLPAVTAHGFAVPPGQYCEFRFT